MRILFLTNQQNNSLALWLIKQNHEVISFVDKIDLAQVKKLKPQFIISYNYHYILKKPLLDQYPKIINLHISYLPYNRGTYPNVWSNLEGTPSGVTIHYIDEGIDTGPILAQEIVVMDESQHTIQSSYDLLNSRIQKLFKEVWPDIASSKIRSYSQKGTPTLHTDKDFEQIKILLGPKEWNVKITDLKKKYFKFKAEDSR
jgi:methionyl-tRNA formyltransferase